MGPTIHAKTILVMLALSSQYCSCFGVNHPVIYFILTSWQRADVRRTQIGRATLSRKVETDSPIPPMPTVCEAAEALLTKEIGSPA